MKKFSDYYNEGYEKYDGRQDLTELAWDFRDRTRGDKWQPVGNKERPVIEGVLMTIMDILDSAGLTEKYEIKKGSKKITVPSEQLMGKPAK